MLRQLTRVAVNPHTSGLVSSVPPAPCILCALYPLPPRTHQRPCILCNPLASVVVYPLCPLASVALNPAHPLHEWPRIPAHPTLGPLTPHSVPRSTLSSRLTTSGHGKAWAAHAIAPVVVGTPLRMELARSLTSCIPLHPIACGPDYSLQSPAYSGCVVHTHCMWC